MSRRLVTSLRKNPTFAEAKRVCDEFDLSWGIKHPTGRGHPKLIITDAAGHRYLHPLAFSPSGVVRPITIRSRLLTQLRATGFAISNIK